MKSLFTLSIEEIKTKIQQRKVTLCVFGLGKMGLPLACAFADAGFKVIGVDTNSKVVQNVNNGVTWFKEPELDEKLTKAIKNKKLTATLNGEDAVKNSDFIIVIVPLILDKRKKPIFSTIIEVTKIISENLDKGHIVGYETTLPIGSTENMLKPILEKSGLKAGKDFGLFYSPERLMAGKFFSRLRELKKIIGAIDKKTAFIASEIYKTICPAGVEIVSNPRTAEMIKLAAGIWRDVNIAFANEMAKLADMYNIDIMEVIKAVNSSPRRLMLEPGCGVGGHCIPVYPYFIISNLKDADGVVPLIKAARKTNESMPEYTVKLAEKELEKKGKTLEGTNIVILGLAYRPHIKETLNSPTLDMVKILKKSGVNVSVYDPIFTKEETEKITGAQSGEYESLLKKADCIIIATMYEKFKHVKEKIKRDCIIIDGRNRLKDADKGIGRPQK
ncbi:nucleotide sugar dehydrogenase [Candidatus Bathyarchaeota archaeon]|nr:nucleotide sugar dehydrogenase [Candidatus Bathyarchaeota archaeon]